MSSPPSPVNETNTITTLSNQIQQQGNKIRQLKTDKAPKVSVFHFFWILMNSLWCENAKLQVRMRCEDKS